MLKMKHWQNVADCAIFAPVAEHSSFVDFPNVPAKKDNHVVFNMYRKCMSTLRDVA